MASYASKSFGKSDVVKGTYAKRIIFSGLSVGPKNVKLGSPEDLRKLAQDCRDDFLRLVGYFSVGRH